PALGDAGDHPPNSGLIDGEWIHGRGTSDMKGGCAAVLTAAKEYADAGELQNVSFAFVCDEENGGPMGVRRLIREKILHPCDCLLAEPTPYQAPCIGQKGLYRAQITFHGTPAHASLYPIVGNSAVMQAGEFLTKLPAIHAKEWPAPTPEMAELLDYSAKIATEDRKQDCSNLFTHISYNPGLISGGEKDNIVAEKCQVSLDFRLPWGVDIDALEREIISMVPGNAELVRDSTANASLTDPKSKIVTATCASISEAYHIDSKPMVQWAASDARAMRLEGINAIEYGPGLLETIHGVNEKISISQLKTAVEIYKGVIRRYQ
ncbi:MAG TPA: M20/M25/M40 family metallo-hydrolase, partial [Methanocorpusculum sp.]|nr:M20/M25/M40 family metallo-hydrolase [Methanocorpusculum sp.]